MMKRCGAEECGRGTVARGKREKASQEVFKRTGIYIGNEMMLPSDFSGPYTF
jgi:hypothetical protein